MSKISNPVVLDKFESYPDFVRPTMLMLRQLILDAATETEGVGSVEETLKWGEPSYLVSGGSTVRIDWKPRSPDHCAMYFNCQSKLVDTFKELYGDLFRYEGNRAVLFDLNAQIPVLEMKHCLALSLRYHHIKHLPMLGV